MILYIGICRVALDLMSKIKFNGGGDRGSYRGHWNSNIGKGNGQNSDRQAHGSGAGYSDGRGDHVGRVRQDGNNIGVRDAQGDSGNNNTPPTPHQDRQRMCGGGQNCWDGGVLA